MATLITTRDFRNRLRKGLALPKDVRLQKDIFSTTEIVDDRRVRFVLSTADADRENDIVSLDGWETSNFELNPVVLLQHSSRDFPIGKCVELTRTDGALKGVVEFVPANVPIVGIVAEATLMLVRGGFMSACSVGFDPIEYKLAKDRMGDDDWFAPCNFTKQELIEWSIVTIPCNPLAVVEPGQQVDAAVPLAEQTTPDAAALALAAEADVAKTAEEQAVRDRAVQVAAVNILRAQRKRASRLIGCL